MVKTRDKVLTFVIPVMQKYCSVKTLPFYHPRKESTWQFKPVSSVSWTDHFLSHISTSNTGCSRDSSFSCSNSEVGQSLYWVSQLHVLSHWVPVSPVFARFKAEARSSTLSPVLTLAEWHDMLGQSWQSWAPTQVSTLDTCRFTEQHLLSQPKIFRSEGRTVMWHSH